MSKFLEKIWPPTKNWKLSILWALVSGFLLQIALPVLLNLFGAKQASWLVMLPGLLPILWATGGFFAGIAPLGYVLMFSINTVVYGLVLLTGFRTCVCLKRHYVQE